MKKRKKTNSMTKEKLPTKEGCMNLFEEYQTPGRAKAHCIMVSKAGKELGKQLNKKGLRLDLDLIEQAGLVHDLVRAEENHGEKAAIILREKGYEKLAATIEDHMKYKFNHRKIDEKSIFCLADRLVLEDKVVDIDKRMDYVIEKFKDHPEAIEIINQGRMDIKKYIEFLEKEYFKKTIEEILIIHEN